MSKKVFQERKQNALLMTSENDIDITQKLGGQTAAQIKAEETAGLPGFQKQLTDVRIVLG